MGRVCHAGSACSASRAAGMFAVLPGGHQAQTPLFLSDPVGRMPATQPLRARWLGRLPRWEHSGSRRRGCVFGRLCKVSSGASLRSLARPLHNPHGGGNARGEESYVMLSIPQSDRSAAPTNEGAPSILHSTRGTLTDNLVVSVGNSSQPFPTSEAGRVDGAPTSCVCPARGTFERGWHQQTVSPSRWRRSCDVECGDNAYVSRSGAQCPDTQDRCARYLQPSFAHGPCRADTSPGAAAFAQTDVPARCSLPCVSSGGVLLQHVVVFTLARPRPLCGNGQADVHSFRGRPRGRFCHQGVASCSAWCARYRLARPASADRLASSAQPWQYWGVGPGMRSSVTSL